MSAPVERALQLLESARVQRLHKKAMRHIHEDIADQILERGRKDLIEEERQARIKRIAKQVSKDMRDNPIVEEEIDEYDDDMEEYENECPRLTMNNEGKFNYV